MPGAEVWGAMISIAVLCTVIAYVLYFRILAAAGATNLLLVTFLLPISALLLGWFVLGESIHPRAFGGMALIGLGLAAIDGRLFGYVREKSQSHRKRNMISDNAKNSVFTDGDGI